ncbi:ribose-phosphate diphosphokinase [Noviherbaspirillum pedocola]|uniref:ribose-phosphate diphosphokinase n=1 Tax=Noviherbaspirillum pedocola TaxID=2801341 RepID=A0A934SYD2_9BURK|nr:ribose-phosphate pyrophosphokinase [Noviherbaspirillum pedocola]MBK4737585.1 ribose-phosphate pyrophosphokinase [Noviherbaspirillum pedocola]
MEHPSLVFALNGSQFFGDEVCLQLGLTRAALEEREFEDKEHKVRAMESVRGKDAFVIHSLHGDGMQSGNDKLCRLLFLIGALRDDGAARVTAVVPYLAYARKDRRTKPQDPVTTRYVAQLFEAVGTDAIISIDVHNLAAFENAFRIPTVHLEAASLFADALLNKLDAGNVAVVSPDAGGAKRAEGLRQILAARMAQPVTMAFVEKYRSEGKISGDLLVGDVAGKDAVIIDDLISTGGTLVRAAHACRKAGAKRVFACATHGIFAEGARTTLADEVLEEIIVADTIPPFRMEAEAAKPRVTVVGCAPLFAKAIREMSGGAGCTAPAAM